MPAPPMKRRIFLDMHFPDWPNRQTSTNFDPDEIAETLINNNVGSVILYAKCQYGNFYYDTASFHKHRGLGKLDMFSEVSSRLRAAGVEVIAYYSVAWDELVAAEHPEWLVCGPNGETDNLDEFRWSTLCINSPYKNLIFRQLEEICRLAKPDGFWIDMTIIGKDRCFCPYCAELFHKRTGIALNKNVLESEELQHRFIQFRYDYIEDFYEQAYAVIREILPDSNISNNYWGYPYSPSSMGSRAIGAAKQADFLTGEAYTDWTGLTSPALFSKFLRGASAGRPFEALIGRFCGTWDYSVKTSTQLALEAYAVASNGGIVTIDDEPYADGRLDLELYADIGKVFGEIKHREHLLNGAPVRFAAIYHSQQTKDYYAKEEAFITSFVGAYRLLKELQCPTEFIFDESLTEQTLEGLRLILLPGVAVLSAEEWLILRGWVEKGGILLCAGATGLFSIDDEKLSPFKEPLASIGLCYEGESSNTLSYFTSPADRLSDGMAKRPLTVRGKYIKYTPQTAKVCADIIDPICETNGKTFFHNNLPAPYENSKWPALMESVLEKGRVFVFAQDVFTQFGRYHQADFKTFFKNILKYTKLLSPVNVSCASNVEISLMEAEGGWVLHLVNFTPGMTVCSGHMDTFEGRYPRTFEFVDEVNPLYNVRITVDLPIMSARAFELGEKLRICQTDGGAVEIILPELNLWESIELK